MSPHDLYDYDGVNENVLIDLSIGGRPRQVLVHPDRNGYMYVIDRAHRRSALRDAVRTGQHDRPASI